MGVENLNKNKCLTVPNILSLIRIMLVVAFCVCYFNERLKTASLYILLLSGLTDMMDGYIARKYNQVSNLGKVLDPFADKLFTVSTIICFCINGIVPVWIAVIIFAKELFMLVGGSVLYKKTKAVIPSKWYGKVTTMLFFMTFILALVLEILGTEPNILEPVIITLFIISTAFSIFSVIKYAITAVRINKEKNTTGVIISGDSTEK